MSQYLTPAARKLRGELQVLAGRDRNAVKAVLGSMLADIVATEPDFIRKMGPSWWTKRLRSSRCAPTKRSSRCSSTRSATC